MTFEIKKYIRNSGKSDYLAGKNILFQAVHRQLVGRLAYGSSRSARELTLYRAVFFSFTRRSPYMNNGDEGRWCAMMEYSPYFANYPLIAIVIHLSIKPLLRIL